MLLFTYLVSFAMSFAICWTAPTNQTPSPSPPPLSRPPCVYMWTKDPNQPPAEIEVTPDYDFSHVQVNTLKIRYLAYGRDVCVYDVEGGFIEPSSGQQAPAIIKRARLDRSPNTINQGKAARKIPLSNTQKDALRENGMLWAVVTQHAKKQAPVEWAVTGKQGEKQIFETAGWREMFGDVNYSTAKGTEEYTSCVLFMQTLYRRVAQAASQFGNWDPNDINWMNFLWSDDLTSVFVFE
ncbi:hypothetical protein FRB99_007885 [Tulasnella sp. 403]|nr:hypothetical protein FRB99_007885 [Tulasnella sp. 403]